MKESVKIAALRLPRIHKQGTIAFRFIARENALLSHAAKNGLISRRDQAANLATAFNAGKNMFSLVKRHAR